MKLYIVRTYVKARNATHALRQAKKATPDDVYVSDEWKQGQVGHLAEAIGFDDGVTEEEEDEA